MIKRTLPAILLGTTASLAIVAGGAQAATATVAGTEITNVAKVKYSVGGTPQPEVTSNTASFVVDKKVNLTVTEVGNSATNVFFGATAQVTTFKVTNLTNATQDFRLVAGQQGTLSLTAFGGVDNMDMTNVHVYVDANDDGIYQAGTDTATFIDELAADGSKTVFIVADVPATGPIGAIAGVSLTAVTANGGGAGALGIDVVGTSGAGTDAGVDIVFADDAGILDGLRDGKSSAYDQYTVGTAAINFVKKATIISDPVNGILSPKAVPGAVVEYCLMVTNGGPGSVTDISITDNIPAGTTYVPGSIWSGGTTLLGTCVIDGTPEDDDATGLDETDINGGNFDGTKVTATMPVILPLTTVSARFRVVIN
ncbi:hypothetical protein PQU92_05800 [Asticcacaulis sp. BYS171W]|uniref:DUF11 domain-containing protein n=1 Tax=Asticcacaulis aquaticus TaxID=2984212 RepID=A0ABT5HRT4_9CAUL|nr:hypothetical protein [Asticcacaulis aquaticus]MDC7682780.1 hypothetical protein [Asticcacaulis aquaticus]